MFAAHSGTLQDASSCTAAEDITSLHACMHQGNHSSAATSTLFRAG